jgi:peptide/nickel transport system permease protein
MLALLLPEFVIGIILVLLLSVRVWHVLPAVSAIGIGAGPWTDMKGMILPTRCWCSAQFLCRVSFASMIEVLESDYVEMARLKAPEKTVLGGTHCPTRSVRCSRSSRSTSPTSLQA